VVVVLGPQVVVVVDSGPHVVIDVSGPQVVVVVDSGPQVVIVSSGLENVAVIPGPKIVVVVSGSEVDVQSDLFYPDPLNFKILAWIIELLGYPII
jgi:hypothetical protein